MYIIKNCPLKRKFKCEQEKTRNRTSDTETNIKMSNTSIKSVVHVDGAYNNKSKPFAWAIVVYVVPKEEQASNNNNNKDIDTNYTVEYNPWKQCTPIDSITPDALPLFADLHLQCITLSKSGRSQQVANVQLNGVDCKQEVNSAELIALLMALRIWNKLNRDIKVICTDNNLVYLYWSKNHVAEKTRAEMSPTKLAYIEECSKLRELFEAQGGKIVKIEGK